MAAVMHATFCVGAIVTLSVTLYIPPDVEFEDRVMWPLLFTTRTSSRAPDRKITDYREAERIAAAWLRRFGYRDAHVTIDGPDNGIDVDAVGAVAQVKNWYTKRVGIKDVQRLVGASKADQKPFFFASGGYTKAARNWARDPEHRVALFVLAQDGNVDAVNFSAFKALVRAPLRAPSPMPTSIREKVIFGTIGAFWLTGVLVLTIVIIATPGVRIELAIPFIAFIWCMYLIMVLSYMGRDVRRLCRALIDLARFGTWVGWRNIIKVDNPPVDPDGNYPSSKFAGHYERGMLGVFVSSIDLQVASRKVRRWVSRRRSTALRRSKSGRA